MVVLDIFPRLLGNGLRWALICLYLATYSQACFTEGFRAWSPNLTEFCPIISNITDWTSTNITHATTALLSGRVKCIVLTLKWGNCLNCFGIDSISHKICTWFCCALFCCGYVINSYCTHTIYLPISSGSLHWHWGNHMIAPVPVKGPWRIWVKSVSNLSHQNTTK